QVWPAAFRSCRAKGRNPSHTCAQVTISAARARKVSMCARRSAAGRGVTEPCLLPETKWVDESFPFPPLARRAGTIAERPQVRSTIGFGHPWLACEGLKRYARLDCRRSEKRGDLAG